MQRLLSYFACSILAGLLSACGGGGNSGPMLPGAPDQQPGVQPGNSNPTAQPSSAAAAPPSGDAPDAAFPHSTRVSFEGDIEASIAGGFLMEGSAGQGLTRIFKSSSTGINEYGGSATLEHYALLVGTGSASTSLDATYIATYTTQPGAVTLRGTWVGTMPYGFEIKTANYGTVPVMTAANTAFVGSVAYGGPVTVQGIGLARAAILASSVSAMTEQPQGNYPSTISQTHVITADYLGTPDGTTRVSAAEAAPHLSWAETGLSNTNAIAAAGIKTMVYLDMNRNATSSPQYAKLSASDYEKTCSGAAVTDVFDGVKDYVVNPASSSARAVVDSWVTTYLAGHTVDAIFSDNSDPLSELPTTGYFSPEPPCDYTDSTWIAGEEELLAGSGHDVIVNGFSRMTLAAPIPNTTALLANSTTIGGNMESCYVWNHSPIQQVAWVWAGTENTSLLVTGEHKYFECFAMDYGEAATEISSRIYALASFLMTYNPTYSIFREAYATPSGLHVMPESQFVPTAPVVSQPTNVSALEESNVYVREYNACYYAGKLVGQCAMVVNNDSAAHASPALLLTYSHTLKLSGSGILDGGSVTFDGPAPPSNLAAGSAFIALK